MRCVRPYATRKPGPTSRPRPVAVTGSLLLQAPLQGAQSRREILQPDQAVPTHRNPLRQARRKLPCRREDRIHPRLAGEFMSRRPRIAAPQAPKRQYVYGRFSGIADRQRTFRWPYGSQLGPAQGRRLSFGRSDRNEQWKRTRGGRRHHHPSNCCSVNRRPIPMLHDA